jgi:LmbE family N-acetylglucosaminyl deacetylase
MMDKYDFLQDLSSPHPFRALRIPAALRVLVLAPHPDDFDAIGVTMRLLRENGNPIHVAVLTSGASGVADEFAPGLNKQKKAALREEEQRASCRFFGLPGEALAFLRLEEGADGHLVDSERNFAIVTACWDECAPDLVFLPHGNDTNADHQRTHQFFRRLARNVPALLNRDPKTIALRPDVFTLFGESEAAWKSEMLRFHQTQQQRNLRTRGYGFDERILRDNRQAAGELGIDAGYAEVFEVEQQAGQLRKRCLP